MKNKIELVITFFLLLFLLFIGRGKLGAYYYNQGSACLEQGLIKESIDYFKKSINIDPTVSIVHYDLANAYMEVKSEDKAIEEYKKSIQLNKQFSWGYRTLAFVYLNRGAYEEAISLLDEAALRFPDDPEVKSLIKYASSEYIVYLINLGTAAFSEGDKKTAYILLNKALDINPDFIFSHYTLGYFYYSDRRYSEAEAELKKVTKLDSEFFLAHKLLGDIYFNESKFIKAIEAYKKSLSISKDATVLNNIGLAYMNLEEYSAAIPFLKEASQMNPGSISMLYALASVYRDSNKLEQAAAEYEKIIRIKPDYPNVHNDLGDIYRDQDLTEKAIAEYRKEIEYCRDKLSTDPNNAFILNDMAYAYNRSGEYEKAKQVVLRALTIKPDFREAYLNLASIFRNLEDSSSAIKALEKAKEFNLSKQSFIDETIADTKRVQALPARKTKPVFYPTEIVYLINGRNLEGKIIQEGDNYIILLVNVGSNPGTVTLSKDNIKRIELKGGK